MDVPELNTQPLNYGLAVGDLIAKAPVGLKLLSINVSLNNRIITSPIIIKVSLNAAHDAVLVENDSWRGRLLIIEEAELERLSALSDTSRREILKGIDFDSIACLIINDQKKVPIELTIACERAHAPLLYSQLEMSEVSAKLSPWLRAALPPLEVRHGVLLDMYRVGVLIEGRSGIGKSECALDLITHGHRLVADDGVEIWRPTPSSLLGMAPDLLYEYLEIRGLGIINICNLFGVAAMTREKEIGLSIMLVRWEDAVEVDRLGIDARSINIAGVDLPQVLLPVSPGRNLSTLVETAVRVHVLRQSGQNSALALINRHSEILKS